MNGFSKTLFCCMIFVIAHSVGIAQTTTIYDGVTPASVAAGSPLGSYSIGDFEDINLFNGTVNFKFPLAKLSGRGNTGYASSYIRQNNSWSVYQQVIAGTIYEEPQAMGVWTPLGFGAIEFKRNVYPQLSNENPCTNGVPEINILTTFVFHEPDGTEHTLFDQATQGSTLTTACGTTFPVLNRGRLRCR